MKIPSQEQIVLTYVFDDIKCYVVTRSILGKYILYRIVGDDYEKLKTANTPLEFDDIVEGDWSEI